MLAYGLPRLITPKVAGLNSPLATKLNPPKWKHFGGFVFSSEASGSE